ncbi:MAG: hypothetical protein OFPII_12990 [Osedax symbiont Rs1]|nr:MAG: hypothetical protein OFPII_12990 [Osedax symbiont Rs1]
MTSQLNTLKLLTSNWLLISDSLKMALPKKKQTPIKPHNAAILPNTLFTQIANYTN